MTRVEFADRLEHYASQVREIRGVGRSGPHAFVEDKSEIIAAMMTEARELRAVATLATGGFVSAIQPGIRTIGSGSARREVRVETRRRA